MYLSDLQGRIDVFEAAADLPNVGLVREAQSFLLDALVYFIVDCLDGLLSLL